MTLFRATRLAFVSLFLALIASSALAQDRAAPDRMTCEAVHKLVTEHVNPNRDRSLQIFDRTICADIVSMDQMLVYNRFGSFNPYGMIYALRRDVVTVETPVKAMDADGCDGDLGIAYHGAGLKAGQVRLRDCKRPRPLTLRARVGDILHVRLTNLLRERGPGFSDTFCTAQKSDSGGPFGNLFHQLRQWVSEGDDVQSAHGEVSCEVPQPRPSGKPDGNWPQSRGANMAIQGLTAFGIENGQIVEAHDACKGLDVIVPDTAVDCYYMVEREGPFFMASTGAPSGGQGDGGSLTHGLFGAVNVQRQGTEFYRSQTSRATFDAVWKKQSEDGHARDAGAITDQGRYQATARDRVSGQDMPLLNMLRPVDGRLNTVDADAAARLGTYELVHSDLNAMIELPENDATGLRAFRELSVFFHDELKTFYPRNFEELGDFAGGQLAGVRDGFAVNYGASGMGDMLLANRKGIGPAANCLECLYEEFFLTSWANGDPALLEQFSEDPSNVHHSYLNDAVVFRNYHAGPKETHVFHLHAHQWFAGNDKGRGSYLDSQTVAPQQGFSYDIYGGGLEVYHKGEAGLPGWYETLGSGNRNRTAGDSIFHCHLYPHFAQGMWELWRVHDVLEDGSRKLPDGQWEPTLSLAEMSPEVRAMKRPGSVHKESGRRIVPGAGLTAKNLGTPIPALVPLPGQAWPLLPTYTPGDAELTADAKVDAERLDEITAFPGYPFYIAGDPGHRPPQAPMDIARELDNNGNVTAEYLDGGLPRHVVTDTAARDLPFKVPDDVAKRLTVDLPTATSLADALGDPAQMQREALQSQIVATALALGDLSMKFKEAELKLLEYDGEPIERTAMSFHNDGRLLGTTTQLALQRADGSTADFVPEAGSYETLGGAELFAVNAAPPKPGAPFADPCGAPTAYGTLERVDAQNYNFVTPSGSFPVYWVDANLAPAGTDAAGDAEVSNWVSHWRTDVFEFGAPKLFYSSGGSTNVITRDNLVSEDDPFLKGLTGTRFTPDPAVVGYRRYEGSAVQVDMITNRAGWHDPQARINVLTARSDDYKLDPNNPSSNQGRISPKVTADEEPFFFRALSGECIEFRHTNELPKELQLDDFQVKTPTDTIGQHIHLVKFDVTSSDGSGNGFNYEDGTFAPDEIAARICAAKNVDSMASKITGSRPPGAKLIREAEGLCEKVEVTVMGETKVHWQVKKKEIWKLRLSDNRELFQTTTQRWFADPILSDTRSPDDEGGVGKADRTLRTVFSHDHFGPSSIQQHGFYTALLIEPQSAQICDADGNGCTLTRSDRRLEDATEKDVGARKVIVDFMSAETDELSYREFALSIADFAVLYDPRDSYTAADLEKTVSGGDAIPVKGMVTLYCEALHAIAGDPAAMAKICKSELAESGGLWSAAAGNVPPAWLANKRPGDDPGHSDGMADDLLAKIEVPLHGTYLPADQFLRDYLIEYRRMAAGHDPAEGRLASPVAPPMRPESISVDHHDPYLVNYRGEPLPLRIGMDSSAGSDCALKDLDHWESQLLTGVTERCTISEQKPNEPGDPANVFLTHYHQDPVTPILRSYDNEPVQMRLIQGAQEVQHTFTIEGVNITRHIDQAFPADSIVPDDTTPRATLARSCELGLGAQSAVQMARAGRPDQYREWARSGSGVFTDPDDQKFWKDFENQLANCFNTEGRIAAQEIGISEHFEFRTGFMHDNNFVGLGEEVRRLALREGALTTVSELRDAVVDLREYVLLRRQVMDTPFHFGSQDALWNGAWGLVRVAIDTRRYALYGKVQEQIDAVLPRLNALAEETPDAPPSQEDLDLLRPLIEAPLDTARERFPDISTGKAITELRQTIPGNRAQAEVPELPPLADYEGQALRENLSVSPERAPNMLKRFDLPQDIQRIDPAERFNRFSQDLFERLKPQKGKIHKYKPVAECPSFAPRVYTAVVAIETRTAFKDRPARSHTTNYSKEVFDQDGLFFALLDPRRILNGDDPASVTDDMIRDPQSWVSISRQHLIDEITKVYDRPEPLVMNVKAGDCVFVTVLNALGRQDSLIGGLADATGDAEMPPITSLNVERDWGDDTGSGGYLAVAADRDRRKDAEPSARLALSLPLPVLTRQSSYARPYGRNPVWALDGVDADLRSDKTLSILDLPNRLNKPRIAQIEQFEFYAGLAFADYERAASPAPFVGANLSVSDRFIADLNRPGGIVLPDGLGQLPLNGGTVAERVSALQSDRATAERQLEQVITRVTQETPALAPFLSPRLQRDLNTLIAPQIEREINLEEPQLRIVPEIFEPLRAPQLDGQGVNLGGRLTTGIEVIDAGRLTAQALAGNIGRVRDLGLTVTVPDPNAIEPQVVAMDEAFIQLVERGLVTEDKADAIAADIANATEGYVKNLAELKGTLLGSGTIRRKLSTNFVPYAFGALPVKSFGDVIGHPTHGLIGAITVVPQNAAINGTRAPRLPLPGPACIDRLVRPRGVKDAVLRLSDLPLDLAQAVSRDRLVAKPCLSYVIVPNKSARPMWTAELSARGPGGREGHTIRQFTLFWQDGLNQRDRRTGDSHRLSGVEQRIVAHCPVCDDSYDFGDKGVSYLSEPFNVRLRNRNGSPGDLPIGDNLNTRQFGAQFFRLEPGEIPSETQAPFPVLRATEGEQVVVHVVHPGGRARQRAFATIGQDYNDLFPGFGFARAALLAPGKAITASLTKPVTPGCYLWFDGPLHLRAGGVWGLLDVLSREQARDPKASNCRIRDRG